MAVNEQEFAQGQKRGRARQKSGYAVAVRYDLRTARIVVVLNNGLELAFPPSLTEGLAAPRPRIWPTLKSVRQGWACTSRCSTPTCIYRRCCKASLVPGAGWRRNSGPLAVVRTVKPRQLARAPTATKVAAHARKWRTVKEKAPKFCVTGLRLATLPNALWR